MAKVEKRLFWLGVLLTGVGSAVATAAFGVREGLSFLAGGLLCGLDVLWLRSAVTRLFSRDPRHSKLPILAGFFLRLLLIPFALYAMIRFLFLDIIAAVAGFAVFICSVFVEGVLEAFSSSSK